jgi:hypothetical protein
MYTHDDIDFFNPGGEGNSSSIWVNTVLSLLDRTYMCKAEAANTTFLKFRNEKLMFYQSSGSSLAFQRNVLPPSSGS